jgi:Zn-dependent M28 family amino/carboxypeptidase
MLDTSQATLREVVETLALLKRRAASPGERQAAEWIAERIESAGTPARIEEEQFYDGYARELLPLGIAGLVAGALAVSGRHRALATAIGAAAAAAIADDASNGIRVWRRLLRRRKRTWNVVATAGDGAAARTLVVLAHHDAAPTGRMFDPTFQRWLARRFPELVQRSDTSPPLWWPVAGAPALAAVGAATASRVAALAGATLSAVTVALGLDIARDRIVPGANDNLSAVAALVALAERLNREPVDGIRVLLVSCGAEEVLQGGIYGFADRHFPALDIGHTWFLNLDTIGSPELVMLEGEGCFVMEDYPSPEFRDLVARAAERTTGPLRRGVRSRSSTDSVIPSRAGYPVATLISWEPDTKLLSNYHLMSDTPENLNFDTVGRAVTVAYALAGDLARG